MPSLFDGDNHEELNAVSHGALNGFDLLMGYVPRSEALPAGELQALLRLINASIQLARQALNSSNGPSGAA